MAACPHHAGAEGTAADAAVRRPWGDSDGTLPHVLALFAGDGAFNAVERLRTVLSTLGGGGHHMVKEYFGSTAGFVQRGRAAVTRSGGDCGDGAGAGAGDGCDEDGVGVEDAKMATLLSTVWFDTYARVLWPTTAAPGPAARATALAGDGGAGCPSGQRRSWRRLSNVLIGS